MKRKRTIVAFFIIVVIAVRITLWGIPLPSLCTEYYTHTLFFGQYDVVDKREMAEFLKQDGWDMTGAQYYNGEATKDPIAFLSKPHMATEFSAGRIAFSVHGGNRIANKMLFDDFVDKINNRFNLDLSYDRYNYIRYCS